MTNKPYNPKDNDTYVEKYSKSMIQDIEIHMFKNPKGSSSINSIPGNYSVESKEVAANSVFQFINPDKNQFKLLKNKKITTPIPFSLLKRYDTPIDSITHNQSTPIFFNVLDDKFYIPFDYRFFRDLKNNNLLSDNVLKSFSSINSVSILETKEDFPTLLVSSENIDFFSSNHYKQILNEINNAYFKSIVGTYHNQDVIVLSYQMEENQKTYFSKDIGLYNDDFQNTQNLSSQIQFSFFKAMKTHSKYLFPYINGEIHYSNHFFVDKNKSLDKQSSIFLGSKTLNNVFPYSDSDWEKLTKIKEKLENVFSSLSKTLNSNKSLKQGEFDTPITMIDIEENSFFLLEDNTKNKKGMKP